MNADLAVVPEAPPAAVEGTAARTCTLLIAERFREYNEEFGRITRRAARHFIHEDWAAAQRDASQLAAGRQPPAANDNQMPAVPAVKMAAVSPSRGGGR